MKKQLIVLLLAGVLVVNSFPCWAEDAKPQAEPDGGAIAAAAVSDIVYIPGKAATCAVSGVLWFVGMTLTAGTVYKPAGELVNKACTGTWVLTGHDFMGKSEI